MAKKIVVKPVEGFHWNEKQVELRRILGNKQYRHVMAYGGAGSGKSHCLVAATITRALYEDGSRHAILRYRFNSVKNHVAEGTFRDVMRMCFHGLPEKKWRGWRMDRQDWRAIMPNESEIWFGGLDEKERTEKLLGAEYSTIFLNECSQISWAARNIALTRLRQENGLRQMMLYDCNPPSQNHWTYKVFVEGVDPVSRNPLPNREQYKHILLNPLDNKENLSEEYIADLDNQSEKARRRFFLGQFLPETDDPLWTHDTIDKYRHGARDGDRILPQPDLVRVVVGVDPSGASDDEEENNDDIGIVVAGLGTDGHAYVLADKTLKGGPLKWGNAVVRTFIDNAADLVVGEKNYGGAMVEFTIQTAADKFDRSAIPYRDVTATRGKVVRAQPIAALYEKGKVHHVGTFPELEDELCAFSEWGYTGTRSPNRADALVWALTELFPGMVKKKNPARIVHESMSTYDPLTF